MRTEATQLIDNKSKVSEFHSYIAQNANLLVESHRAPGLKAPLGLIISMCPVEITEDNVDEFYAETVGMVASATENEESASLTDELEEVEEQLPVEIENDAAVKSEIDSDTHDEYAEQKNEAKETKSEQKEPAETQTKEIENEIDRGNEFKALKGESETQVEVQEPFGEAEPEHIDNLAASSIESSEFNVFNDSSGSKQEIAHPGREERAKAEASVEVNSKESEVKNISQATVAYLEKQDTAITPAQELKKSATPATKNPKQTSEVAAIIAPEDTETKDAADATDTNTPEGIAITKAENVQTMDLEKSPKPRDFRFAEGAKVNAVDAADPTVVVEQIHRDSIDEKEEDTENHQATKEEDQILTTTFGANNKSREVSEDNDFVTPPAFDEFQKSFSAQSAEHLQEKKAHDFPLAMSEIQPLDAPEYVNKSSDTVHELPASVEEIEQVIIEITGSIDNLEEEKVKEVHLLLDKVITKADEIRAIKEAETENPEAILKSKEAEEKLRELFVQLFEYAEIEYTPELIDSCSKLILETDISELMEKTTQEEPEEPHDRGTHEAIKKLLIAITKVKRSLVHAYKVGESAIRLYSQQLALKPI